jgi:prevent-host-death family protein
MSSYSIAAGQKKFPEVVALSEKGDPVPIERHGETVAYVISKQHFDAVLETMELLSNPEFAKTMKTYRGGKTKWVSVKDIPEGRPCSEGASIRASPGATSNASPGPSKGNQACPDRLGQGERRL